MTFLSENSDLILISIMLTIQISEEFFKNTHMKQLELWSFCYPQAALDICIWIHYKILSIKSNTLLCKYQRFRQQSL